jgi:kinesin family protein 11
MSSAVNQSYGTISQNLKSGLQSVRSLGNEIDAETHIASRNIDVAKDELCMPLTKLREEVTSSVPRAYEATGDTPTKAEYQFNTNLPRTESHEILIARMLNGSSPSKSDRRMAIFSDSEKAERSPLPPEVSTSAQQRNSLKMSLQEINRNSKATLTSDPTSTMPRLNEEMKLTTKPPNPKNSRKRAAQKDDQENSMLFSSADVQPKSRIRRLH